MTRHERKICLSLFCHSPKLRRRDFVAGAFSRTAVLLATLLTGVSPAGSETPSLIAKPTVPAKKISAHPLLGKKLTSLPGAAETGAAIDLLAPDQNKGDGKRPEKRWVVVYFWAAQCPCVRSCQTLSLFPLYRKYAQRKDVAFYAVASNASDLITRRLTDGSDRTFLRQLSGNSQSPPYPVILDARHQIADAIGASSTPQCFLIDPDNRVVFSGNPDDSEEVRRRTGESGRMTRSYLGEALTDALAGKPIRQFASPALGCDIERKPS